MKIKKILILLCLVLSTTSCGKEKPTINNTSQISETIEIISEINTEEINYLVGIGLAPENNAEESIPKPNKDNAIVIPGEEIEFKNPKEETETLAPNQETQSSKPNQETQSSKPNQETQSSKPNQETQSSKPNQETQSLKPNQETQSLKPNQETQSSKPNQETQSSKPNQETQSSKPNQETQSSKPNQETQSSKPNQEIQSSKPSQETEDSKPNQNSSIVSNEEVKDKVEEYDKSTLEKHHNTIKKYIEKNKEDNLINFNGNGGFKMNDVDKAPTPYLLLRDDSYFDFYIIDNRWNSGTYFRENNYLVCSNQYNTDLYVFKIITEDTVMFLKDLSSKLNQKDLKLENPGYDYTYMIETDRTFSRN
jgi:hypothetical protein